MRIPWMLCSRRPLSIASRSCAARNSGRPTLPITTNSAPTPHRIGMNTASSRALVAMMKATLPPSSTTALTMCSRPAPMNCCTRSTSLVERVRSCPVSAWSWKLKDSPWILSLRALRMSKAAPCEICAARRCCR